MGEPFCASRTALNGPAVPAPIRELPAIETCPGRPRTRRATDGAHRWRLGAMGLPTVLAFYIRGVRIAGAEAGATRPRIGLVGRGPCGKLECNATS